MTTLRDLSRHLGLSVTQVSRVATIDTEVAGCPIPAGSPRTSNRYSRVDTTSSAVRLLSTSIARHSRVDSSTTGSIFRPRPSALCSWCSFQEYCPSFGGDPARVRELVGA